jgi:hypothetical protein
MRTKTRIRIRSTQALLLGALLTALPATASTENSGGDPTVAKHLTTFDDLDYNVFSGQKWSELHRSHSHDVIVHWPDGHTTKGIDKHTEDLRAMFVWAPRIKQHPVKLGERDWTAVMEGTFTQPMPTADGKFIQATGKPTRSRWRPSAIGRTASWTRNTCSGTTRSS